MNSPMSEQARSYRKYPWRFIKGGSPNRAGLNCKHDGPLKLMKVLYALVMWAALVPNMSNAAESVSKLIFREVSSEAGIDHRSPTFGASWGDFNGDGWPDLWVGDHYRAPVLYLNNRDGTFSNIATEVWSGNPEDDAHGAAWADYDNDGDQDLIEMVGAQYGQGVGPNHFYENIAGVLREAATEKGLAVPYGRGRSPMWVDIDSDGYLDLILMNASRPDGRAPSGLYMQVDGRFVLSSDRYGFSEPKRGWRQKLRDLVVSLRHGRFGLPAVIYGHSRFAQLTDFSDDGKLDIMTYAPLRIYEIGSKVLMDKTYDYAFPRLHDVRDAAMADYDGDLQIDIYYVRSRSVSDVVQIGPRELRASLLKSGRGDETKAIKIVTPGDLEITMYPGRSTLSDVYLGSKGDHPKERTFSLEAGGQELMGRYEGGTGKDKVSIWYEPTDRAWWIDSSILSFNMVITASEKIESFRPMGFQPSKGALLDKLLLAKDGDLIGASSVREMERPGPCRSVVAADFDNDMDVDLYLVCTGPAKNEQNRLLLNAGRGHFREIPNAGGAAGSKSGRGETAVVADYDRDGFIDIFVTNGAGEPPFCEEGPHQLYKNLGNDNRWLEVDLEGKRSNRDGIGAKVIIEAGGVRQVRVQDGGMHNIAQNHSRLHFGLGDNDVAERLTVIWPSGVVQTIDRIQANQILKVVEDSDR